MRFTFTGRADVEAILRRVDALPLAVNPRRLGVPICALQPHQGRSRPRTRSRSAQEIIDLTGQEDVPVLVIDDGSVVAGSSEIAAWARDHHSV